MAVLFGKTTPTIRKTLTELLKFVVDHTQAAAGGANVPATLAEQIEKIEPGLIQVRGEKDPGGNIFAFATSKGVVAVYPQMGNATGGEKVTVGASDVGKLDTVLGTASKFVLEEGFIVPPAGKRGGIKGETYPFAEMKVGQSFFIPVSADRPTPWKAMGSTVSSANKRFAAVYPVGHEKAGQSTGKDGRLFTVRARKVADGEKADGARIYRIS